MALATCTHTTIVMFILNTARIPLTLRRLFNQSPLKHTPLPKRVSFNFQLLSRKYNLKLMIPDDGGKDLVASIKQGNAGVAYNGSAHFSGGSFGFIITNRDQSLHV